MTGKIQRIHAKAPDNWVNDPNGLIYYKGYYHLFYQYFPYAPRWGTMHWGHAVSRDLVNWEHRGIALFPTKRGDENGCFSGSAVEKDGRLCLIYTGVRYEPADPEDIHVSFNEQFESCQMMISSEDGFHFDNWRDKEHEGRHLFNHPKIALKNASESTKTLMGDLANALSALVRWVIRFAPLGVMGLVFNAIASSGLSTLLGYLRLDSESTDYVLRDTDLDGLLRQAVRKFARMFILKKIALDLQETGRTVLTDEKWLSFVVEQVLSNALKYTPAGGRIRIYGDGETVVIADSGIGIREEDLPRVFEKGFTGYNGREDRKSTGIGLYLCRRVMDRLNHSISIVSRPGQGTLVRLDLSRGNRVVE